jgi:hypothetical protein
LSCLAYPLRLKDGLLSRCNEPQAIVALVQAMARTPAPGWAGSSNFGLRDLLEDARRRPALLSSVAAKLNLAFGELGVKSYRVEAIEHEASIQRGVDSYVLTLAPAAGGQAQAFRFEA